MMLSAIFGWFLKNLSGDVIGKALDAFTKTEDIKVQGKQIDSETVKQAMSNYIESQKAQNEIQKAKFQFPWFWLLIALFILPLGAWWSAIMIDSIFGFTWNVANLPTPELREWAGQMIAFLFYTGGTVAGIKAILGNR